MTTTVRGMPMPLPAQPIRSFRPLDPVATAKWFLARGWRISRPAAGEYGRLTNGTIVLVFFTSGDVAEYRIGGAR